MIHGVCDSRFEAVREALAEALDKEDVGASAAVYLDGEPVNQMLDQGTGDYRALGIVMAAYQGLS